MAKLCTWVIYMLEHYLKWYHYALEALEYQLENIANYSDIDKIIVTGMGGSGIVGDILASVASDFDNISNIYVYKDFYIPKNMLTKSTFVLAISYSGNTLETISSTLMSLERGSRVGIVTSGGRLLEIARSRNLPYIIVKSGLVPRLAMPMMLIAAIRIIGSCGINLIPIDTIKTSIEVLNDINKAIEVSNNITNLIMSSSIPTIVASTRYQALAYRFKNEINENSKIPVKVEIMPELFHNDIVGWENSKLYDIVILIDSDIEYENNLVDFYENYLRSLGAKTYILPLTGNIIERYLFGSLVAGISSVYIAKTRGLDPVQTKSISMYKNIIKTLENKILERNKYHL